MSLRTRIQTLRTREDTGQVYWFACYCRAQKVKVNLYWHPWNKLDNLYWQVLGSLRDPAPMNKVKSNWGRPWCQSCLPHANALMYIHRHVSMHVHIIYTHVCKRRRCVGDFRGNGMKLQLYGPKSKVLVWGFCKVQLSFYLLTLAMEWLSGIFFSCLIAPYSFLFFRYPSLHEPPVFQSGPRIPSLYSQGCIIKSSVESVVTDCPISPVNSL